jgi:hypothetical protein
MLVLEVYECINGVCGEWDAEEQIIVLESQEDRQLLLFA